MAVPSELTKPASVAPEVAAVVVSPVEGVVEVTNVVDTPEVEVVTVIVKEAAVVVMVVDKVVDMEVAKVVTEAVVEVRSSDLNPQFYSHRMLTIR